MDRSTSATSPAASTTATPADRIDGKRRSGLLHHPGGVVVRQLRAGCDPIEDTERYVPSDRLPIVRGKLRGAGTVAYALP